MTFGRHFIVLCQYGFVHSQCRCPDNNKTVIPVNCSIVEHAQNPQPDALGENL